MRRTIFNKTIREVALPTGIFIAEAIVAVVIDRTTPYLQHVAIPDITLTLIGTAISIMLAFRVNAGYARWWEARTLCGALVNASRSLARQVLALAADGTSAAVFARRIVELQIRYVGMVRAQLQDDHSAPADQPDNLAILTLTEIAQTIHQGGHERLFDTNIAARMDASLSELTTAQGGCERIRGTPLPMQFSVLSSVFVYLYAFLLPLALADSIGIIMPIVSGMITFTFLTLSEIGTSLENPFGGRVFDISLQTIINGIENVLRTQLAGVEQRELVSNAGGIHLARKNLAT